MSGARRLIVAVAVGVVLASGAGVAVAPVPAEAGGPAKGHRGHLGVNRGHQAHHVRPFVNPFYPPPGQGVHAAPYSVVPPRSAHVPAAALLWVPGHWTTVWVPTFAPVDVWVPAHYADGGAIVPGQWTQQTVETGGYHQPVWVNGHWGR
jgi:hypothetical protein